MVIIMVIDWICYYCYVLLVIDWICYYCYVQHRLESLDMRIDLFVVFGEMGGDLNDQHTRSQGVVGRRTLNLLSLVLDSTEFLTDRS
jgi:hypothetical protein